jgi:hypothetical protein
MLRACQPGESTATDAVVWDGLLGIRREPWNELSRKMTGTVVLTGDAPIENVDEVLRLRGPLSAWEVCLWAALVLGLVFVIPLGPRALRGLAKRSMLVLRSEEVR